MNQFRISTELTHKSWMMIGQALERLGWISYGLEEPDDAWLQIRPSDSLILLKQLEDSRYNNLDNVPFFLITLAPDADGLYTIVFPQGQNFDTMQELLMWADEF